MALKKIILNAEEINLPTKLSDLENDLNLGGGNIDTSNFATKETVMTSEISVIADGFKTSNGVWFALPSTKSDNNADFGIATFDDIPTKTSQLTNDDGFITIDDIPKEVELITISGDMLADEPTYTATEAQAIIDAYNANKLIAIKCGTRINFGKGWFIPNINIRTQSGMSQIFLSGILGNYYIEHRIVFDTSAGTISTSAQSLIDLSEIGGSSEGGEKKIVIGDDLNTNAITLKPNEIVIFKDNVDYPITILDIEYTTETDEFGDVYPTMYDEYSLMFRTGNEGSTSPSLSLPSYISWANGEIPTIENGFISYELSIVRKKQGASDNAFSAVLTSFKAVES